MEFKKGFYEFSQDAGMNFQLNRFYSLGGFEEIQEAEKLQMLNQLLWDI